MMRCNAGMLTRVTTSKHRSRDKEMKQEISLDILVVVMMKDAVGLVKKVEMDDRFWGECSGSSSSGELSNSISISTHSASSRQRLK